MASAMPYEVEKNRALAPAGLASVIVIRKCNFKMLRTEFAS
jgi:hypothetical protein